MVDAKTYFSTVLAVIPRRADALNALWAKKQKLDSKSFSKANIDQLIQIIGSKEQQNTIIHLLSKLKKSTESFTRRYAQLREKYENELRYVSDEARVSIYTADSLAGKMNVLTNPLHELLSIYELEAAALSKNDLNSYKSLIVLEQNHYDNIASTAKSLLPLAKTFTNQFAAFMRGIIEGIAPEPQNYETKYQRDAAQSDDFISTMILMLSFITFIWSIWAYDFLVKQFDQKTANTLVALFGSPTVVALLLRKRKIIESVTTELDRLI